MPSGLSQLALAAGTLARLAAAATAIIDDGSPQLWLGWAVNVRSCANRDEQASFYGGTEVYHDDDNAEGRFSYNGTSFAMYGVRTRFRSAFLVRIDGGDWEAIGDCYDGDVVEARDGVPSVIASSPEGMAEGEHQVQFRKLEEDDRVYRGSGRIAIDYIEYEYEETGSSPSFGDPEGNIDFDDASNDVPTVVSEELSFSTLTSPQSSSATATSTFSSNENENREEEEEEPEDQEEEEEDSNVEADTDERSNEDVTVDAQDSNTTAIVSGAAVGVTVLIAAVLFFSCWYRSRSKRRGGHSPTIASWLNSQPTAFSETATQAAAFPNDRDSYLPRPSGYLIQVPSPEGARVSDSGSHQSAKKVQRDAYFAPSTVSGSSIGRV